MSEDKFLYKKVYVDLREKIEKGEIPSGSRLPAEGKLCETYHVSVITVKRALQMLAEERFVRRIPGKGSFVIQKERKEEHAELHKEETAGTQKKRPKVIGVILEHAIPSFGIDLMYELDGAARAVGHKVCIRFSYGDRERETEEIEFLTALGIAGLIISPCHGSYYNMAILKLVVEGFPVVVVDKRMEGIHIPSIRMDNADAIYRLVDYLNKQGKRRIGMISVNDVGTVSLMERRKAFRERIDQLRLPVMEECILPETSYALVWGGTVENYVMQIEEYLKRCGRGLDGIICMEYGVFLAFLEAVSRQGKERFSDILPCSVDEVYSIPGNARYAHVKQNEAGMAKKAVEILVRQMAGEMLEIDEIKIPGHFSTASNYLEK